MSLVLFMRLETAPCKILLSLLAERYQMPACGLRHARSNYPRYYRPSCAALVCNPSAPRPALRGESDAEEP